MKNCCAALLASVICLGLGLAATAEAEHEAERKLVEVLMRREPLPQPRTFGDRCGQVARLEAELLRDAGTQYLGAVPDDPIKWEWFRVSTNRLFGAFILHGGSGKAVRANPEYSAGGFEPWVKTAMLIALDVLRNENLDKKNYLLPLRAFLRASEVLAYAQSKAEQGDHVPLRTLEDVAVLFCERFEDSDPLAARAAVNLLLELTASLPNEFDEFQKKISVSRSSVAKEMAQAYSFREKIGKNVFEWSLKQLDGTPITSEDLKGKVLLVDFWSIGCAPCREEFPKLKTLRSKYAEKGFEILSIELSPERLRPSVENVVREEQIPWFVCFDGMSTSGPFAKALGIVSMPTYVLIGRDGKVISMQARGPDLENRIGEACDRGK